MRIEWLKNQSPEVNDRAGTSSRGKRLQRLVFSLVGQERQREKLFALILKEPGMIGMRLLAEIKMQVHSALITVACCFSRAEWVIEGSSWCLCSLRDGLFLTLSLVSTAGRKYCISRSQDADSQWFISPALSGGDCGDSVRKMSG